MRDNLPVTRDTRIKKKNDNKKIKQTNQKTQDSRPVKTILYQ